MSDFINTLYKRNTKKKGARNLNCAVIGESGLGKSWGAIRICEVYYKEKLNKPFPVENIVFTISDFLERIKIIEKCECIIFDDSGLKFNSARWFDELNQILGYTLQSYRYKIINVFFTIPVKKWLDRIGRGMLHGQIEMKDIGKGVYYKVWLNQLRDKEYHYRRWLMTFDKPNARLVNLYEDKKRKFLIDEYEIYLKKAKRREGKLDYLTTDEMIEMVLLNKDKFTLKGKLNKNLIANHFDFGLRSAYRVIDGIRKLEERTKAGIK